MVCPKCNSKVRRSRRQGAIEKLASVVGIYPYRCVGCKSRFPRFRHSFAATKPARLTRVEREIKLFRALSSKKRARREFLLYGTGILFFLGFLYFLTRERSSPRDEN